MSRIENDQSLMAGFKSYEEGAIDDYFDHSL